MRDHDDFLNMQAKEVFTPGSFPTVTFVSDHLIEKQRILRDALDMGNVVVALSGPSKSGKTVLVERVIGKDNLLHITGSGVDSPKKLWERVFDLTGAPVEIKTTEGATSQSNASTTLEGGIGGFLKGQVGGTKTTSEQDSVTRGRSIDSLQLLIREIKGSGFALFIDDFHYINHDAQIELAQHIKEAIRQGIVIICASVPYHSDDVL